MTTAELTIPIEVQDAQPRLLEKLRDSSAVRALTSIFDQAAVSATNFLTGVMIGRACSPDDLGIYALIMSVFQIAIGIQSEFVSTPYAVFCHKYTGETYKRYAGQTMLFQGLILAIAASIIAGLFGYFSMQPNTARLQGILLILLWAGPMIMTKEFLRQFSFARLELYRAVAIDLLICGIQLAALAYLFFSGQLDLTRTLIVIAAAATTAMTVWLVLHRDMLTFDLTGYRDHLTENFSYSRWSVVTYLLGNTTPFLMPWVLVAYVSEHMIGIYSACSTLMGLSYMFVIGIANMLKAKASHAFTHGGLSALLRVLMMTLGMYLAFLIPFCVVVFFYSDWLMRTVFGDEFAGYGQVSFIIALNVLISSVSIVVGNGLCAMRRPKANVPADIATMLSTVAVSLALIPTFGIVGAAYAYLAGTTAGVLLRTITAYRVYQREVAV